MYASMRRIAAISIACFFFAALRCSPLQTTGNGGTGSETVIGKVVNEDGTPARETEVMLHSSTFDPASGLASEYGVDTTDSGGNYAITLASPKADWYTMQAVNLRARTRTFVPDIGFSDSRGITVAATASLHRTGSIKVILSDSLLSGNGHVYIPGTSYYAAMENGVALLDSVPAQTVPYVDYGYRDTNGAGSPQNLAQAVEVKPGVESIVAFSGSAHTAKWFLNTTSGGAGVLGSVYGFPVLIRLSADNFNFSDARTDGSDLRFNKSDNTALPFEIERWDAAARSAEIWVKIDTVYGNDSSHFFVMYWGEPATAIAPSHAKVFDTAGGFKGVWHLAEEAAGIGTKGLYKDATGRNDGDDFISATDRTGIIGYGHAFNGVNDYILINDPVTNFKKADFTISLWVSIHDSGGTILSKLDSTLIWKKGDECFYFGDGSAAHGPPGVNGSRPSFVGYTDSYAISAQSVAPGEWHYLAYSWKWLGDSTGTSRYFIDGTEVSLSGDSLFARTDENSGAVVRIGQPNDNESYAFFKGLMDELEISSVARGADWIRLQFMNQRKENGLVHQ